MKRLAAVCLLGVVGMAGLSLEGQVRTETMAQVQTIAHAKHLHFIVKCAPYMEGKYIGWAYDSGHHPSQYIEEGGRPGWWSGFTDTQQQAAENLRKAMQGPPNIMPDHKPMASAHTLQCSKPIEGGPQ